MEQIIKKVVVGSRLHGIYNENSDWDYRGVFILPLKEFLSPYKKNKNTSWIEGEEDNTSYELTNFCKLATQGNMTILEVLYSNIVKYEDEIGKELTENKEKFLNSKKIFEAARGYAANQLKKLELKNPDDKRNAKYIIAYLRVMQQGIEFLQTGNINCQISRNVDFIKEVKWNFSDKLVPEAVAIFQTLEKEIVKEFENKKVDFQPNIDWIENFIKKSYLKEVSMLKT